MRRRRRLRKRGRPSIIKTKKDSDFSFFSPFFVKIENLNKKEKKKKEEIKDMIVIHPLEYEILVLSDYKNKSCDEISSMLNLSRSSVWRLLNSARKKIVQSLVERKILFVGLED